MNFQNLTMEKCWREMVIRMTQQFTIKRYFWLFGSLLFLPRYITAQELEDPPPHATWSVGVFLTGSSSISSSMHGMIEQYEDALRAGSAPARYPFGDNQAYSAGFGMQADRRLTKSPVSIFFGWNTLRFNAGTGFRNSSTGRFTMAIFSADGGLEYTFGQIYQHWNFYGRIGLSPTIITSSNRGPRNNSSNFDTLRSNTADSRVGLELEVGERYHFSRSNFGIEASINYSNINLFGKSYSKPINGGALFGGNNSINDGKNPNDPNDNSRTIDYVSIRIGGRYYFN